MKILGIYLLLLSPLAFGKRVAPKKVPTLSINNKEYSHIFLRTSCREGKGGFRYYIQSKNQKSDTPLWRTQIFQRQYDCGWETDIQDIHLSSLKIENGILLAKDEYGSEYKLNPSDGKLLSPSKTLIYPRRNFPIKKQRK